MTITLVSKGIADSGSEFYYIGPLEECEGCKLKSVCNGLEAGARYRVTALRKQEHDCPALEDGKVVAAEVEKVPSPAILPKKGLLEGVTVTFSQPKCERPGCPNWRLCHPVWKEEGCKVTVVRMGSTAECPEGERLAFVDILRRGSHSFQIQNFSPVMRSYMST